MMKPLRKIKSKNPKSVLLKGYASSFAYCGFVLFLRKYVLPNSEGAPIIDITEIDRLEESILNHPSPVQMLFHTFEELISTLRKIDTSILPPNRDPFDPVLIDELIFKSGLPPDIRSFVIFAFVKYTTHHAPNLHNQIYGSWASGKTSGPILDPNILIQTNEVDPSVSHALVNFFDAIDDFDAWKEKCK